HCLLDIKGRAKQLVSRSKSKVSTLQDIAARCQVFWLLFEESVHYFIWCKTFRS
ncbi:hypothetical protein C0J52_25116, partial [Blattella germanica]